MPLTAMFSDTLSYEMHNTFLEEFDSHKEIALWTRLHGHVFVLGSVVHLDSYTVPGFGA